MFFEKILNDPCKIIVRNYMGGIGIYSQNGRGVFFSEDRTFLMRFDTILRLDEITYNVLKSTFVEICFGFNLA